MRLAGDRTGLLGRTDLSGIGDLLRRRGDCETLRENARLLGGLRTGDLDKLESEDRLDRWLCR